MSYIPANYDAWLTKPYDDAYASETTTNIVCSEFHEDEERYDY